MSTSKQPEFLHSVLPIEKVHGALLGAAVGDAWGWPQEYNAKRVKESEVISESLAFQSWRRRCGGRFYLHEEQISAGEYSDDTQLLLATARSLRYGEQWAKISRTMNSRSGCSMNVVVAVPRSALLPHGSGMSHPGVKTMPRSRRGIMRLEAMALPCAFVTTQVGWAPEVMSLYCMSGEGMNGRPSKASRMASKTFLACLRAVERYPRMRPNCWAPSSVRNPPETFCLTFTIRISRSP